MSAAQFFLPHLTATVAGIAQPGAEFQFYRTGTLTPLAVFADSGLTVSRGSTITANGVGALPTTYLDNAVTYRLIITDKNGAQLDGGDIDPFIPGTIPDASVLSPYSDAAAASATASATSATNAATSATNAGTSATAAAGSATSAASSASTASAAATVASTSISSIPNATAHAATRTALAALSTSSGPAYLTESGREGTFVFDGSNLSVNVAADTAQGIYVAPASDTTGVSGAWVRKYTGPVSIGWFGAQGLGDTSVDESGAFLAAKALFKAIATTHGGLTSKSGPEFHIPPGHFYLGTTTFDIDLTMILRGETVGENGGAATTLRWADGTTGIRIHNSLTTGASGTKTADGFDGSATIIENLLLEGGYAGTESESHGIHLRGRATIRNVYINNFPGDGIFANVTAGSGGATEGNANNTFIERVVLASNRVGLFLQGADANAGMMSAVSTLFNRRWGIYDNSFLGNGHFAHHADGNGTTGVGGSVPFTMCSSGGNLYSVALGQGTGASTNAPSGTTADNTWWLYNRSGAPTSTIPAWSSGMSVRDGGCYFSSSSAFRSCYAEGDQGCAQTTGSGLFDGSSQFAGVKGYGFYEHLIPGTSGTVAAVRALNAGLRIQGAQPNFLSNLPAGIELYIQSGKAIVSAIDRASGNVSLPLVLGGSTVTVQGAFGLGDHTFAATATPVTFDMGATQSNAAGSNPKLLLYYDGINKIGLGVSASAIDHVALTGMTHDFYVGATKVGSLATTGLTIGGVAAINGSGVIQAAATPAFTGDVTKPAGSLATTIAAGVVSLSKIANAAASSKILGSGAAGSGASYSELTLGTGLSMSGTTLNGTGGTVTTVSVTTANGVSGSVATATTTPAITITLGAITPTSVAATGAITSSGGGVGYATGAGGAVTQATSKSTGVTLSKLSGQITMNAAALAAAGVVSFTVTNTQVAATDTINLNLQSGNVTAGTYRYWIDKVSAGSFVVAVENRSAGSLSEALILNFAVVKAVAA